MNWKKAAGLYAAYKIGQGSRKPTEPANSGGPKSQGPDSGVAFVIEVILGLGLAYLLIKLGV